MTGTALALARTVADIIEEYEQKHAAADDAVKAYDQAANDAKAAACVAGAYVGTPLNGNSWMNAAQIRKMLRESGWKAIYNRLNIDKVATAADRRLLDQSLKDPPELTLDNAIATFGKYLMAPRFHILRGLAECFTKLDPAYKSHSKVKIGVKGLPKRVILNYWSDYSESGARGDLKDLLNAMRAYRGLPLLQYRDLEEFIAYCNAVQHGLPTWQERRDYRSGFRVEKDGKFWRLEGSYSKPGEFEVSDDPKRGWKEMTCDEQGITARFFKTTQTVHVIFDPETIREINLAMAEFYGDVLPDMEDDGASPPRPTSRAVAKDLQYYPTPEAVIDLMLRDTGLRERGKYDRPEDLPPKHVLEPSCGDGRIMDVLRSRGHRVMGIEVHIGRADQATAKGHSVFLGNFLECEPRPVFDYVVMNPPFYGQHWRKHIRHALKFLKPGGRLVSVLPATAHYDHEVEKEFGGQWTDLPVASFAESGTNIPTGFVTIYARAASAYKEAS